MIPVSNEYKEAINKDVREFDFLYTLGVSHFEFDMTSTTIQGNIDISGTEDLFSPPLYNNYARLEQDYFLLDGSFILPNNDNNKNTGIIGNSNNCIIQKILYTHLNNYKYPSIGLYFANGYATSFSIEITDYDTEEVYFQQNYTNDKEVVFIDIPLLTKSTTYKEIITITGWSKANQYPKIKYISRGDYYLDATDFISFSLLEQTDLQAISVPANTLSLKLNNYDRRFDILNKNSNYNKIQNITAYLGLRTENNYEYIKIGTYNYKNYKENNDKTVDLEFYDFDFEDRAYISSFFKNNISASSACSFFLPGVSNDVSLLKYQGDFPAKYVNTTSSVDRAQLFTTYYNASVKKDRSQSSSYLLPFNISENEEYIVDLNKQIRNPQFTKYIKTKKIIFKNQQIGSLSSNDIEIYNDKVEFKGDFGVISNYASLSIYTQTPVSMTTLKVYKNDTQIYDYSYIDNGYFSVSMRINKVNSDDENKTYKITAKSYNTSERVVEVENSNIQNGATLELNNNVITTEEERLKISRFIFDEEKDFEYEFETEILGDIRLEVGDIIKLQSLDGYHKAIISSIDTTYNGGLTQIIKGVCGNVLE